MKPAPVPGDLWVRSVEDELRGVGLKFQLPGEEPVILEKAACDDLRLVKAGADTGDLRFDCRRDGRRFRRALQFRR